MEKWEGHPPPETRLTGAIIAGPLLVIGCFWLGWSGEYSYIPWYVPMLSTIPIGCGVNLVFASFLVGYLFFFVKLVFILFPELLDRHVSVSFFLWTVSLDPNVRKNVYGVCFCRQHGIPLCPWRCVPSVHHNNV